LWNTNHHPAIQLHFFDELHFTNVNDGNIDRYIEAVNVVTANAAALGFKSISIPRRGAGNVREVIGNLFYHVIVRVLSMKPGLEEPRGLVFYSYGRTPRKRRLTSVCSPTSRIV
jgi:hypothetical protein